MWMYIIIPLVLLVIVLIHYLRMKSADKPSPSSVLERSKLEKLPEAIAEFTRAIELDPKYELAYFERGKAYLKMENKEDACRDFNEAYRKGCLPAHHYVTTICNDIGESS